MVGWQGMHIESRRSMVSQAMFRWYFWFVLLIYAGYGSILFDESSFLNRNAALSEYKAALLTMPSSTSLQSLLRSYNIFPSVAVARKLGWIYDILGDQAKSVHWQSVQIRTDNITHLYWLHEGIRQHYAGEYVAALELYDMLLGGDPHNAEALYHKGVAYQHLGDIQHAAEFYYQTLEIDPFNTKAILNLAALHQKYGSFDDAVVFYLKGAEVFALSAQDVEADQQAVPFLHPHNAMVQYNLGLAYMQQNELEKAYGITRALLKHLQAVDTILAAGDTDATLIYDPSEIHRSLVGALGSLSKIQRAALNWAGWEVLHEQLVNHTLAAIAFNRAHYCDNIPAEEACQAEQYATHQRRVNFNGPLLPFDTLMLPLSMEVRLEVAIATSLSYQWIPYSSLSTQQEKEVALVTQERTGRQRRALRLGFISYDFTDHPTAHLIKAIFQIVAQARTTSPGIFNAVELVIFSYGRDDGSSYRRNLENLAHKFVDVVNMPFSEAAAAIRAEEVDILLDLQIHTLGSRLEITAAGVAPTVVNYLVYPGTSGGRFYDYLAVDRVVVPPEQARYYSEALLVLPATYQVSSYDAYAPPADVADVSDRLAFRRHYGLPEDLGVVVFCNFNKINKIDPESFQLWMQVMRQVPNSYLWLMDPGHGGGSSTTSKTALLRAVAAEGVEKRRIVFAGRASKAHHVHRHAAADLFLDTIVYGAHSTATDALRGGLPVLTLQGEAFASRVAASLYASLALGSPSKEAGVEGEMGMQKGPHPGQALESLLVVDSAKEFVDTAVRIGRQVAQLRKLEGGGRAGGDEHAGGLKGYLDAAISAKMGLFNATRNVELFVRGMQVVEDAAMVTRTSKVAFRRDRLHVMLQK